MDTLSIFILSGILFLLTPAFVFWVSNLRKPYNSLLFNIHTLIALGLVVGTVNQLYKLL